MAIERRNGLIIWRGVRLPRGVDGLTLGRIVLIDRGLADPSGYLLRHETVHVRQWKRFGPIGFVTRYVGSYLVWRLRRKTHLAAYLRIPLEVEADWVARRTASLDADRTRPQPADRELR